MTPIWFKRPIKRHFSFWIVHRRPRPRDFNPVILRLPVFEGRKYLQRKRRLPAVHAPFADLPISLAIHPKRQPKRNSDGTLQVITQGHGFSTSSNTIGLKCSCAFEHPSLVLRCLMNFLAVYGFGNSLFVLYLAPFISQSSIVIVHRLRALARKSSQPAERAHGWPFSLDHALLIALLVASSSGRLGVHAATTKYSDASLIWSSTYRPLRHSHSFSIAVSNVRLIHTPA